MQTVTIYIQPRQKKLLNKRAKEQDSTFSEQIRNAIDQYLSSSGESYSEKDLKVVVDQTDKSVKNIIKMLGQSSSTVRSTLSRVRAKLEAI